MHSEDMGGVELSADPALPRRTHLAALIFQASRQRRLQHTARTVLTFKIELHFSKYAYDNFSPSIHNSNMDSPC